MLDYKLTLQAHQDELATLAASPGFRAMALGLDRISDLARTDSLVHAAAQRLKPRLFELATAVARILDVLDGPPPTKGGL